MKSSIIVLLTLSLGSFSLSAQSFSFQGSTPDTVIRSNKFFGGFYNIVNTSNDTYPLQFQTINNTIPSSWGVVMCTGSHCYTGMPNGAALNQLSPGEEEFFDLRFNPGDDTGFFEVSFRVFEPNNPSNSDTLHIQLTVVSSFDDTISGNDTTGDVSLIPVLDYAINQSLTNYPNPFSSITMFSIENENLSNAEIQIVDIQGRVMDKVELNDNTRTISYSTYLPSGMYFCYLYSNNELLTISKIQVTKK